MKNVTVNNSVKSDSLEKKCENIDCEEILGYFDLKNGRRFCRKCRVFHKVILWKCATCPNIISSSQCRETRLLCDRCKGLKTDF